MVNGIFVVFTNCTDPKRHEEFNRWYSQTHIKDLGAAKGFVRARRFVNGSASAAPGQYLALYEFQSDSLPDSVRDLTRLAGESFPKGRHIDCLGVGGLSIYRRLDPIEYRPPEKAEYSSPKLQSPTLTRPKETVAATQQRGVVLEFADCADPSKRLDFEAWYAREHIATMRAASFLQDASVYRAEEPGKAPAGYLAVYDLVGPDVWASLEDLLRISSRSYQKNRVIDCFKPVATHFFQEIDASAYPPLPRLDYPKAPPKHLSARPG